MCNLNDTPNWHLVKWCRSSALCSHVPQSTKHYLDALLAPVLHCFDDPDHRVRYYACESLYNIAKVCPCLPDGRTMSCEICSVSKCIHLTACIPKSYFRGASGMHLDYSAEAKR